METGFDVIGSIIIGILTGFIANKLPRKNKPGLFTSFAIGMTGALTGSFVLNLCRIDYDSLTSTVLIGFAVSAIVATIFLYTAFILNKEEEQQQEKQKQQKK